MKSEHMKKLNEVQEKMKSLLVELGKYESDYSVPSVTEDEVRIEEEITKKAAEIAMLNVSLLEIRLQKLKLEDENAQKFWKKIKDMLKPKKCL